MIRNQFEFGSILGTLQVCGRLQRNLKLPITIEKTKAKKFIIQVISSSLLKEQSTSLFGILMFLKRLHGFLIGWHQSTIKHPNQQ